MKKIRSSFGLRLAGAILSRVCCPLALLIAAWLELRPQPSPRPHHTPDIGMAGYSSLITPTIGEVIRDKVPRDAGLAVWGGSKAKDHDLPFRFRITADWFLLPEKPISIVTTLSEAVTYEYILSPWALGGQLDGSGRRAELLADENRVWLYRMHSTDTDAP